MLLRQPLLILTCFLLSSCQPEDQPPEPYTQLFSRSEGLVSPFPLYQLRPPAGWERLDSGAPAPADTTVPLAHYRLIKDGKQIDLTIHNFPFDSLEQSIKPQAQLARWKKQFEQLDESSVKVLPQAFAGFVGLSFEGKGKRQSEPFEILAWAMQLAPSYFTALEMQDTPEAHGTTRQRHADFTIKVYGNPELIESERPSLNSAARTFALIEDLPTHN